VDPDLAQLPDGALLVLYDGVCGLCNGVVKFLLARDRRDRFRFAALQSELGRRLVRELGGDPDALSTIYVVARAGRPDQKAWRRGRGVLVALDALGGGWRVPALLRYLPAFLLDAGYWVVARTRYRLFGKLDACPVPPPEQRRKFVA
jgi:predicted DCC family thiol-disulfide oxidoreductase YuxK